MKLSNDLHSCGVPYSCNQCIMKGSCGKYGYTCTRFYPDNTDSFMEMVVHELKRNTLPSKDKRLKRRVGRSISSLGMKRDDITTLDDYYVRLINDTLSEIRYGKMGYVFTLSQLQDVIRFERDIKVRYCDGCYEVSKVNYKNTDKGDELK